MNQMQYRMVWPPFTLAIKLLSAWFGLQWLAMILIEPLRPIVYQMVLVHDPAAVLVTPWRLLTYGFFEPDFMGAFFAGLGVWLFGAELEHQWGLRKWWLVQVGAILIAGILAWGINALAVAIGMPLAHVQQGWSPAVTALAAAYCIQHWHTPMSFFGVPMTGKVLLAFFVGLAVVMSVLAQNFAGLGLEAGGVIAGYIATRPTGIVRDLRTRLRIWQARRRLKVVKRPEDDRPDRKMMN